MLKTVSTSGQISLGAQYAGRKFEVQFEANGTVILVPVKAVEAEPAVATRRKPKFQIVKVERFLHLTREELNERRPVR